MEYQEDITKIKEEIGVIEYELSMTSSIYVRSLLRLHKNSLEKKIELLELYSNITQSDLESYSMIQDEYYNEKMGY